MTSLLRPALILLGVFTLVLGLAAPLAVTGIAQAVFPFEANGSLVQREGRVVGSALIGQTFTDARYFHPRPSATTAPDPQNPGSTLAAPYNAVASAASQLGPSSTTLLEAVRDRVAVTGERPIPADAATASASGLDPHISLANAMQQVPRVARARGVSEGELIALVNERAEGRWLGLLGEPRINVLRLNLALGEAR